MNNLKCTSDFIRMMYQHQSSKSLNLEIPKEIEPYVKKLIRLHKTPGQLLSDPQQWINEWQYLKKDPKKIVFMYYYDEKDPDLMIDPIDNTDHRKTWAICFEAYLRRQLMVLYGRPAKDIMLKNVTLLLPAINPHSNDPDDICVQQVKIKSFPPRDCDYTEQLIPPKYRHFTWYVKKGSSTQLPKFRCRPALLNSMDCMSLLHDNMEFPSKEIMIKVAYYLRPFRFFLPLTFLFDIFGGFRQTPAIEYSFPDHVIKNRFPDKTVLADQVERSFLEIFQKRTKLVFSEEEVILPHRANVFLAGGSVSYMLDLTNDFNDLDIYIEYEPAVFTYLTRMTIIITTIDAPNTLTRENIWVNERDYADNNEEPKRKIPIVKREIYTPPDPKIIFQNRFSRMVKIHSVYNLNPKLAIVRHLQAKYNHLPQIIFIKSNLEFNEYNILKMITSFDLPICRNALAFKHAKAFHLRKPILERLYSFRQINDIPNVINFINSWENDEEQELLRKMDKIEDFDQILPKERETEYFNKRKLLEDDTLQKAWHLKQQRKMLLIKWAYDTVPMFDKKDGKTEERIKKYLKRLPKAINDFEKTIALPMQVYPLKYLSYWELQKNVIGINQNCLCNFNYCFEYDTK